MADKASRTDMWIDLMDLFHDTRDWPIGHIYAEGVSLPIRRKIGAASEAITGP